MPNQISCTSIPFTDDDGQTYHMAITGGTLLLHAPASDSGYEGTFSVQPVADAWAQYLAGLEPAPMLPSATARRFRRYLVQAAAEGPIALAAFEIAATYEISELGQGLEMWVEGNRRRFYVAAAVREFWHSTDPAAVQFRMLCAEGDAE